MKRTLLATGIVLAITTSMSAGAEKLKSFDHAAELTSQAKTILWRELNEAKVPAKAHRDIVCLAENIYFESRAESIEGKAAVANVTRNRVNSDLFPNNYCDVVQQGPVRESWKTKKDPNLDAKDRVYYPIKHRCQFSWYCDGAKDIIWANKERSGKTIQANAKAWTTSVEVAIWTLGYGSYRVNDNTEGALWYYAHNLVYPNWADEKTTTAIIGNHTFQK